VQIINHEAMARGHSSVLFQSALTEETSKGSIVVERIQEMDVHSKVNEIETLVSEALKKTNGACIAEAEAAVQAAVHRARTKGNMLPHLDVGLVLAALEVMQTAIHYI